MHPFLTQLYRVAAKAKATIVLAEAEDPRVVTAAQTITKKGIANVILIGDPEKLRSLARGRLKSPILDPKHIDPKLAEKLYELRKKKGMTLKQAKALIKDPHYLAAMLVQTGVADGYVGGNLSPTASTLRPALQLLKRPGKRAFSYFLMLGKKQQPFIFADCALNTDPEAPELADIAIGAAGVAKTFGLDPKVAMLSYSTHGSADGWTAEHVRKAMAIVKRKDPRLAVDELQFDAAIIPSIAERKAPKSKVAGQANILIFPDLASGNIAYKLAERVGGWQAVGPLLSGLKRPANDLSRGCSADDIVAVVAVTAIDAKSN